MFCFSISWMNCTYLPTCVSNEIMCKLVYTTAKVLYIESLGWVDGTMEGTKLSYCVCFILMVILLKAILIFKLLQTS